MLADLRFALRGLAAAPGFTAAAILTVALAVGANTAVFSIADAVLFRPLPYGSPDNLLIVQMATPSGRRTAMVVWDYVRGINEQLRTLSDVATLEAGPSVVADTPDGPERIRTAAVSANYFEILQAQPARGRLFVRADAAGAGRVAVLSYEAWSRRFARSEAVVGSSVAFGTERFDIVGVLPPGLLFPSPLAGLPELIAVHDVWDGGPNSGAIYPLVRLEPGQSVEQAQAEITALASAIQRDNPKLAASTPVLVTLRSVLFPAGRPIMRLLVVAAALVLLLGCANLTNLFLARVAGRERDLGVRTFLGASPWRAVRPAMFEAAIVGLAGAATALAVTWLTFDALLRQVPPIAYRGAVVGVDGRISMLALLLGGASGLLLAAVVARRAARRDVLTMVQRSTPVATPLRFRFGPMIGVQVSVAVVLVFGASVAARALVSVLQTPLAFTPDRVVTISVAPPPGGTADERLAMYRTLVERLAARADVVSAGAITSMPLSSAAAWTSIPGPDGRPLAGIDHVLPGFFESIQARLLRGRLLLPDDLRGPADVAVASESAARTLFSDEEPVGRVVRSREGREFRVVGVIADIRGKLEPDLPVVYTLPDDARIMTVAALLRARSDAVLAQLRRDASGVAAGQPVAVRWWSDELSELTVYRNPRFQTIVLGGFALLALALTATGVFGLISFLLAHRMREMGIRAAVGATSAALTMLLVRHVAVPVGVGLGLGLWATNGLARLAEAQLYRVQTDDPVFLAVATLTVAAAALVAAYIPARRVRSVDPVVLLRAE
jgi:predicted permease